MASQTLDQTRLETPTQPRLRTPTQPRLETPTQTRLRTPTQPRLETPTQPRLRTPTQPRLETPTQPRLEAWMKASLQRSASLGLEVLARASRRSSVDWSSSAASQTPPTPEDSHLPVKRKHSELHDVFGTIADFMAHTTHQCKRFYESGCCPDPTDTERNHVSRFHSQTASTTPEQPHPQGVWTWGEDVSIEVSPGSYVVTASRSESQQQQLIRVRAGESISLKFEL